MDPRQRPLAAASLNKSRPTCRTKPGAPLVRPYTGRAQRGAYGGHGHTSRPHCGQVAPLGHFSGGFAPGSQTMGTWDIKDDSVNVELARTAHALWRALNPQHAPIFGRWVRGHSGNRFNDRVDALEWRFCISGQTIKPLSMQNPADDWIEANTSVTRRLNLNFGKTASS